MPQDAMTLYRWRRATQQVREVILRERQDQNHPCHSPKHIESDETSYYMLTAACFEHCRVIGHSLERMAEFSNQLIDALGESCSAVVAWVVLPNHYHDI